MAASKRPLDPIGPGGLGKICGAGRGTGSRARQSPSRGVSSSIPRGLLLAGRAGAAGAGGGIVARGHESCLPNVPLGSACRPSLRGSPMDSSGICFQVGRHDLGRRNAGERRRGLVARGEAPRSSYAGRIQRLGPPPRRGRRGRSSPANGAGALGRARGGHVRPRGPASQEGPTPSLLFYARSHPGLQKSGKQPESWNKNKREG